MLPPCLEYILNEGSRIQKGLPNNNNQRIRLGGLGNINNTVGGKVGAFRVRVGNSDAADGSGSRSFTRTTTGISGLSGGADVLQRTSTSISAKTPKPNAPLQNHSATSNDNSVRATRGRFFRARPTKVSNSLPNRVVRGLKQRTPNFVKSIIKPFGTVHSSLGNL